MLKDIENYVAYLEDLTVGDRFVSPGRTITEADVTAFAGLSGDYNPLHTDAEYARETPYGQRIAHGLLVLAVVSGLSARTPLMRAMEKSIIGLVNLECRWKMPTLLGDTIRVALEIADKRISGKPDRGIVVLSRSALNQRDEVVMESDWTLLVRARTA